MESISTFWNRLNGAYNLKIRDIGRIEELGRNVVAGTPNARLVCGRWRYITRPVEGDAIYTDCESRGVFGLDTQLREKAGERELFRLKGQCRCTVSLAEGFVWPACRLWPVWRRPVQLLWKKI